MMLARRLPAAGRPIRLSVQTLIPYVILLGLLLVLASQRSGEFSLDQLNLTTTEALTLILVAAGQTIVILVGGIDLSVGGIVSLTTVLAATHFAPGGAHMILWIVLLLLGGMAAGALNGLIITRLGIQPIIVTLASWSVWSGISLVILPAPGGIVPNSLMDLGNGFFAGLANPVWFLLALIVAWALFVRTRLGTSLLAVGSSTHGAHLGGVSVTGTLVAAYALSGLLSAVAGLYLLTQTSGGSPIIGNDYILPSIAAVAIGGARLTGGYARLAGTIAGAFILTVVTDVVTTLGLPGGWSIFVAGALLVLAIVLNEVSAIVVRWRARLA